MTLIAGYKRFNTIFLIADSAYTVEGENLSPLPVFSSAFGEKHVDLKEKQIHTQGLKLIRLTISRKNVASFMATLLQNHSYERATLTISEK